MIIDAAINYVNSGLSVIPIRPDGSKGPIGTWKEYQGRRLTPEEISLKFKGKCGIAILGGAVSGNLEILDFDEPGLFDRYEEMAEQFGIDEVVLSLPLVKTPSDGRHLSYRCTHPVVGNTKLAMRKVGVNEKGETELKTLLETRGEGGYVLAPPSPAECHELRRPYILLRGDLTKIPVITPEQREELLALARSFNEYIGASELVTDEERDQKEKGIKGEGERPGDAFNSRATWPEILEPHGWVMAFSRGETTYWRRPGKTRGISATTSHGGHDFLYVFSTNASPFEHERGYSKFAAYTLLNHGGDFKNAAKALAGKGDGKIIVLSDSRREKGNREDALQGGGGKEEEPILVPLPRDEVEPFPVEVLPTPLRRFVEEGAPAIGVPPDFLGVPLLVEAGSAIGNSRCLSVKKDWKEGPRMYAAIVSPPGTKKSPALDAAFSPLKKRQAHLVAEFQKAKEKHAKALAKFEVDMARWQKALKQGNADPDDKPEKPEDPIFQQVYTTNTTLEALVSIMRDSQRGIVLYRDELSGWVSSMNQYKAGGKGADRQEWLSFWSGSQILVNRKNLPEPIFLPCPFVNVIGCVPPDILGDLTDERGREDGFIHRILFSFPDPVHPLWTDEEISSSAWEGLYRVFDALWGIPDVVNDRGVIEPIPVPFTSDGRSSFIEWHDEHVNESRPRTFNPALFGPWAKMEGYCARLALILQLCRFVCREATREDVDEKSVAGAAALISYFKSHTRRVYAKLRCTEEDKQVERTIEWIKEHEGRVTTRDIITNNVANVKKSSEAKELFELLRDRGLGTVKEETPSHGGSKSVVFYLSNYPAPGNR